MCCLCVYVCQVAFNNADFSYVGGRFMNEKTFRKLLVAVTAAGIITTAALAIYTAVLYSNASIISFIAGGK